MKSNPNQVTAKTFVELIESGSYRGKNMYDAIVPLTNVTCFCGAGFSKSWDKNYPTGNELFSIKLDPFKTTALHQFLDYIGYKVDQTINSTEFKEIVYQLDMQLKYPSIRMRYTDSYNILIAKRELAYEVYKKFNDLVALNYLTSEGENLSLTLKTTEQRRIINFFKWLHNHETGNRDNLPEGIRIHYLTTNYDFLIESILDHTSTLFGSTWHQKHTYRGFSTSEHNGNTEHTIFYDQWLVRNLIKINGGFEIFEKGNEFRIDYRKPNIVELKKNPPIMMLPSREQDYTSSYFQAVFPKAVRLLQESKILVIIGSGLPEEDALLRILLRQFAEEKIDSVPKFIFYIDFISNPDESPKDKAQKLKEKLYNVYPYLKFDDKYTYLFTYDKGFNEFTKDCQKLTKNYVRY